MPRDEAGKLAWAVKHMEVESVKEILSKWPQGAALIDAEDNTLFHLLASEPSRASANPSRTEEVVQLLLRDGWVVVDMKNRKGERAEIVAGRLAPGGAARQLLEGRSRKYEEPSRSEKPLTLIGEASPVPWQWTYLVQDEKRRSFAGVVKGAVPAEKCSAWYDLALNSGHWADLPDVPRRVAWYVSEDFADCNYRYSGLEYPATVFPPWMQELRREVCTVCGIPEDRLPNSCNVNVYDDHKSEVGWHSDDEVMFQSLQGDTAIVSFSLGSPRDFCWRQQGTTQTLGCTSLGDGDIMTMEGLFQKHYKHSVPAVEGADLPCGKRINFTFRWIVVKAHAADATTKAVVQLDKP